MCPKDASKSFVSTLFDMFRPIREAVEAVFMFRACVSPCTGIPTGAFQRRT